jgi:hypothetical protein
MVSEILALMLSLAAAEATQSAHPERSVADITISVDVARHISDAVRRYAVPMRNMKCYGVFIRQDGDIVTIQFFAKNDTIVTKAGVTLHASGCSPGAVYVYDKHGFKSVTYIR